MYSRRVAINTKNQGQSWFYIPTLTTKSKIMSCGQNLSSLKDMNYYKFYPVLILSLSNTNSWDQFLGLQNHIATLLP